MFVRTLLAASFVLLLSVPADAQMRPWPPGMQRPGGMGPPASNEEGAIQAIVQGGIRMVNKGNQPFNVLISPQTTVHVNGTAEVDYIRKGVYVQFTADVDSKHTVKEKISQLMVFTPTHEKGAGLFPPGGAEGAGGQDDFIPPTDAATPKAATHPSTHKSSTTVHKPAAAVKLPATCLVRGQVKSCQGKNILVVAGRGGKINAVLADDVAIKVDVADISAATKGDAIMVKGRTMPTRPGQGMTGAPGIIQAEVVTITAAQPLSGGKKKTSRTDHSTHPAKKTSDDKDKSDTTKGAGDKAAKVGGMGGGS